MFVRCEAWPNSAPASRTVRSAAESERNAILFFVMSSSPQPTLRILRAIVLPNLEVKIPGLGLFSLAHPCNRLSSGDAITRGDSRSVEVPVKRKNSIPVIQNDQVSVPPEPLGKENCSLEYGPHRGAGLRLDFQAVVRRVGCKLRVTLSPEALDHFPLRRPRQSAAERADVLRRHRFRLLAGEHGNEALEAPSLLLELGNLHLGAALLLAQTRQKALLPGHGGSDRLPLLLDQLHRCDELLLPLGELLVAKGQLPAAFLEAVDHPRVVCDQEAEHRHRRARILLLTDRQKHAHVTQASEAIECDEPFAERFFLALDPRNQFGNLRRDRRALSLEPRVCVDRDLELARANAQLQIGRFHFHLDALRLLADIREPLLQPSDVVSDPLKVGIGGLREESGRKERERGEASTR